MEGSTILIKPDSDLGTEFIALYRDFEAAGEKEWCDSTKAALRDFPGYVQTLEGEAIGRGISNDWAPTSHFWLLAEGQLIGTLRVRHYLTPAVEERAGHIGYDISPSFRQRGYGQNILSLALLKAREIGIQHVLAICDEKNVPSRRILECAGGEVTKTRNGEIWYVFKALDSFSK